jgi:hypothetical protein
MPEQMQILMLIMVGGVVLAIIALCWRDHGV